MRKFLFMMLIAFSGLAHAADTQTAGDENFFARNRSNPGAMFWAGGNIGVGANDAGYGMMSDVNLRIKWGRCGAIGSWRVQDITINDPARVHNSILGAGLTCAAFTFGDKIKFLQGANVSATLMAEYGRTVYHLYDKGTIGSFDRELAAGSATGLGGAWGVDFNYPLLFGFWTNIGIGYEKLSYRYDLSNVNGTTKHIPSEDGYIRLGLSYGI